MRANWFKIAKELLRWSRAERALAISIFLLFQALLPSYAGAISAWSGEDRLVICTAHGLVEIEDPQNNSRDLSDGGLCVVAQSAAADMALAGDLLPPMQPQLGSNILGPQRLQSFQYGVPFAPQAARAPPVHS